MGTNMGMAWAWAWVLPRKWASAWGVGMGTGTGMGTGMAWCVGTGTRMVWGMGMGTGMGTNMACGVGMGTGTGMAWALVWHGAWEWAQAWAWKWALAWHGVWEWALAWHGHGRQPICLGSSTNLGRDCGNGHWHQHGDCHEHRVWAWAPAWHGPWEWALAWAWGMFMGTKHGHRTEARDMGHEAWGREWGTGTGTGMGQGQRLPSPSSCLQAAVGTQEGLGALPAARLSRGAHADGHWTPINTGDGLSPSGSGVYSRHGSGHDVALALPLAAGYCAEWISALLPNPRQGRGIASCKAWRWVTAATALAFAPGKGKKTHMFEQR